MGLADRYAGFVTDHSRLVVAVMLVATLVVGSAAADVDSGLSIASFESDSTEAEKLEYLRRNFSTGEENSTVVQVVVRGENVLTKESLLETLRFQRALKSNPTVDATLRNEGGIVGLSNLIATAAIRGGFVSGGPPERAGEPATRSLSAQIEALESTSAPEVEDVVARVLDPNASVGRVDPYSLLPTDYEPGSTTAMGRVVFVFQDTGKGDDGLPRAVVEAQLEMASIADEVISTRSFVFGAGIVDERSGEATGESFALISPVALFLVLVVLGIAYRDVLDVVLGLLGVALVLVWMAGVMGWAGIGVTQILIAVPFLLIGLSIDYALHVVMRYREVRVDDPDATPEIAMRRGLAGVVVAIAAATFTTAVGFASNVVSPIVSIREFGIVSAAGIVSAFLVFGVLLPALKLELDGLLERTGAKRRKRPFGRGGSVGRALSLGADVARRAPLAVILIALVVSAGGAVAATDIDTSIDQVDFLPRDTPEWMASLPEPFRPGEYDLRSNALYLNEQFARANERSRALFLIEGPVTAPATLDRIAAGRRALANTSTALRLANGDLRVTGPLETIERVAAENASVRTLIRRNDPDDDGVPEENLGAIYDAVYEAAPEDARTVVHRTNGEVRALRLAVGLAGGADTGAVTREMRDVATTIEGGTDLRVTATGQPIVRELIQRGLLRTLLEGFLLTFGVIVAFLSLVFWRRYGTLSLGLTVMAPVVLAQGWLFGTMYLRGIPFNTETAIIASIAIGIGVDYAIHVGERYVEERQRAGEPIAALRRTVRGTGGALLASAASTAGGFGVLLLALVPSLQRFGFVTAVAIVYAFLASVLVLPSLLVLRERYLGFDLDAARDRRGDSR